MPASPSVIVLKKKGYTIEVKQTDQDSVSSVLVMSSHIVKRHCETRLEQMESLGRVALTKQHKRLIALEQIALNPSRYAYPDKPARPLSGAALIHWLASQMPASTSDIRDLMLQCDDILFTQMLKHE